MLKRQKYIISVIKKYLKEMSEVDIKNLESWNVIEQK